MRVKFSQNATMENAAGELTADFKAGETHDLADDQAQRWIKRGKAAAVDTEALARPERSPDDAAAEKLVLQNAKAAEVESAPVAHPVTAKTSPPPASKTLSVKSAKHR